MKAFIQSNCGDTSLTTVFLVLNNYEEFQKRLNELKDKIHSIDLNDDMSTVITTNISDLFTLYEDNTELYDLVDGAYFIKSDEELYNKIDYDILEEAKFVDHKVVLWISHNSWALRIFEDGIFPVEETFYFQKYNYPKNK